MLPAHESSLHSKTRARSWLKILEIKGRTVKEKSFQVLKNPSIKTSTYRAKSQVLLLSKIDTRYNNFLCTYSDIFIGSNNRPSCSHARESLCT